MREDKFNFECLEFEWPMGYKNWETGYIGLYRSYIQSEKNLDDNIDLVALAYWRQLEQWEWKRLLRCLITDKELKIKLHRAIKMKG